LAILRKAHDAAANDPEFITNPPSATGCLTRISALSAAAACSGRSPTCRLVLTTLSGDDARNKRRLLLDRLEPRRRRDPAMTADSD
jgi:hypothetical protein